MGINSAITVDPEAVSMLTSMGYSEEQVSAALQATDNNIERCVLFCMLCVYHLFTVNDIKNRHKSHSRYCFSKLNSEHILLPTPIQSR